MNIFFVCSLFCFLAKIDGRPNALSAAWWHLYRHSMRERERETWDWREEEKEKEKLAAESVAATITAS